jgi:glycolate oxidase FAD binding subunit
MAGSYGTLGVFTEVSFKVLPKPETQGTLVLQGLSDQAAVAAMCQAMGSPFEVTGATHDPATGQTALRVEGFEQSVFYRIGQLEKLLSDKGAERQVIQADASDTFWCAQRDVDVFQGAGGDVWRVSCKPTDAPDLVARAGGEAALYDWAGGLIWLRMAPGTDLRARLGHFDGHATIARADDATKARFGMFHPESAGVARLTAGLRAQFDPKSLFNAGLMAAVA